MVDSVQTCVAARDTAMSGAGLLEEAGVIVIKVNAMVSMIVCLPFSQCTGMLGQTGYAFWLCLCQTG